MCEVAKRKLLVHWRGCGCYHEISIWCNSVANRPVHMIFDMPVQNCMPMTMNMSDWKPEVEFQYGGRSFSETK